MSEPKPLAGKRVCLDPGHPSEVGMGTRGRVLTEVGVAWTIALRVGGLLLERGAVVQLTKSAERENVVNQKRADIANRFRADLLLRFHCDAAAGRGVATYYPDRQGKTKRGVTGPAPAVLAVTKRIAPTFHRALIRSLAGTTMRDRGLKTDMATAIGAMQGALTGSIFSQVPVLLVEMAVLTNAQDEAFLRDPKGHERMAIALADAAQAALTA
ncbi:MAG: N-acetylmuramoyl-L-alanine amidase [Armatimonadetes bacterium]|nr:N-acetylmuramoyl-L-alanine amidase [Armatimonadota bacterium]